ncbi:MAG: C40 family peptidase [Muribaculaceae bacterium]|nr:C40 family peptidase [Muribaculaceae bacterium]
MKSSLRLFIYFIVSLLCVAALSSCSSHRKSVRHKRPRKPKIETIHVSRPGKVRSSIASEAMTWLGTPYRYAAQEKGVGTDCSGMVLRVYEDVIGVKMPRNSAKQAEFCKKIDPDDVEVGDLVFFATGKDPNRISHVGIVLDDNRFIHASTSKGVVISDLYTPYYIRTFMMFGRVPR